MEVARPCSLRLQNILEPMQNIARAFLASNRGNRHLRQFSPVKLPEATAFVARFCLGFSHAFLWETTRAVAGEDEN
jgi:hypothetical protein